MLFTQKHTYTIVSANNGIGYLVVDETGSPWGYFESRISAEFQIDFLTSGKSLEQRISEFEETVK
jgi:hypothetical protein